VTLSYKSLFLKTKDEISDWITLVENKVNFWLFPNAEMKCRVS